MSRANKTFHYKIHLFISLLSDVGHLIDQIVFIFILKSLQSFLHNIQILSLVPHKHNVIGVIYIFNMMIILGYLFLTIL